MYVIVYPRVPVHDAKRPLLPVARRELVTDLRDLQRSDPHLGELEAVLRGPSGQLRTSVHASVLAKS